MMTEKEVLELKIQHLRARRKLVVAEITLEIELLEESLSLQKGFTRSGKYGFKYEAF